MILITGPTGHVGRAPGNDAGVNRMIQQLQTQPARLSLSYFGMIKSSGFKG